MRVVSYQGSWSVSLADEQYEVGKAAVTQPNATHYTVFRALKEAGVPVRAADKYPASQAATALFDRLAEGDLA